MKRSDITLRVISLWKIRESWGGTNDHGMITLPPIHMGSLKLKVKAKGYRSQELEVPTNQLGDPVRVTMKKK